MSKVYSFRLDENNPREAQAKEVIEAWVEKGYSLRRIIVDALLLSHLDNHKTNENEDVLQKIAYLLENMNTVEKSIRDAPSTLTDTFVGSISKSVKNGIRIK